MEKKDCCIVEYMDNRKWETQQKNRRRQYLHRLAQQSKSDPDIASKIGGMLIYNQLIEQFLADIVQMSIYYIKAKIWPVSVSLDADLDKATFGKVIEYFTQFATVEPNRELILSHLKKFNTKRNQVVHDLFDIEDLKQLAQELDEYAELAEEILRLLTEYESQVRDNFCALDKRRSQHGKPEKTPT